MDNTGCRLEFLNREIRRDHRRIAFNPNRHAVAGLDQGDMFALLVHQEVDDRNRGAQQHFLGPLARPLFFQRAQNLQRHAVIGPDQASAVAMLAGLGRAFQHPRTQALAAHLQQTEGRDAAHLNAGAVGFQLVFQTLLNRGIVAPLFHVDEVDHDQAGKIAQTQLARDFLGGLKVGLESGILDRAFLRGPARVHVDRNQRLGDANHDIAAGFQLNRRVEHARQIAFDLIAREKRGLVMIGLHGFGMARHDHAHEVLGHAVAFRPLDQNLVNLAAVEVADGPLDEVAFLIDPGRRDGFQRQLTDLFPQTHQIFVIAFDLWLGALGARRADDQARAFRHFDLLRDFLELLAVGGLRDLAGNPAAACRIRHQDAIATGQRQIGCQGRAFVAALFLDDLHQHDLANLDHFLDLVAARARAARGADFFADIFIGDGFNLIIRIRGVIHRAVFGVFLIPVMGRVRLIGLGLCLGGGLRCGVHRVGDGGFCLIPGGLCRVIVKIDDIHAGDFAGFHRVARLCLLGLGATAVAAATATVSAVPLVVLFGPRKGALLIQQRLTVCHRDLVVIRMNLGEGEKAVAIAAVIDECRLKRGFDARYLGKVDVAGKLTFVNSLKVEFFNLVSIHHHHPSFLGMSGVYKHFLGHCIPWHLTMLAARTASRCPDR